ncbi:MAG: methionyl-tRNA formyltransferase [Flavobacteriaceae bacterium]|nr:methionyl-tRNA formyltransferase [Flavobacteriaceae bacterium]|tara:strand:+ start:5829 stop:6473 length:645 start_codon:yes stop_codon:yes gene_type:complete
MSLTIEHIEYNTEREHLIIPEYGRHIQKMINHAIAQESKDERNKLAKAIISVMGNMQPHLRDVPDFQHKLWDQLFIMSKFKLDADSPFDKPSEEILCLSPDPLAYPQNYPKYRFYGNNIKIMIDAASYWEDGDMKTALIFTIANHMKKSFLSWNKDTVEDIVILNHLFELSNGKIDIRNTDEKLTDSSQLLKMQRKTNNYKSNYKKNNRNRKRY